jgi:ABC-2 type transport system permease protein
MRNIWTIAKREYNAYYNSPLAYVVMAVLFFWIGIIFALDLIFITNNFGFDQAMDPTRYLASLIIIILLSTPLLTMRLIAEEARTGTLELLLTAPLRDWELVTGKWLGAFLFMLTTLALTIIFPVMINGMTNPGIDWVQTASSYLGMLLAIAAFLAIGVGISAIFTNQFAAFFTTFGVLLVMWVLIGAPASLLPAGSELFSYLDMSSHFSGFTQGNINLTDILYYLSLTALGLFTGNVAVEYRRWK